MLRFRLLGTVALLCAFCSPLLTQPRPAQAPPPAPQFPTTTPQSEDAEQRQKLEQIQRKARLKQHTDEMKRDSAKLLELAAQLKDAVDKADDNVLSMDIIRKTEQVEKLAQKIRKSMQGEEYDTGPTVGH